MPEFFIPAMHDLNSDQIEELYSQLAAMADASVPQPDKRIYSIAWRHDGQDWTATVGEKLSGVEITAGRDFTRALHDEATVLAIFAGDPYTVVTNARPLTGVVSAWVNPFMAGIPTHARTFDDPTR